MRKMFYIIPSILLFILGSFGTAWAINQSTVQPVYTVVTGLPTPTVITGTTKLDVQEQMLINMQAGRDECYYDGSFVNVSTVSCDGQKPPPVGGHCNGVTGGGLLSAFPQESDIANGFGIMKEYIFLSRTDCGSIWGAVDDFSGTHGITQVTLRDTTDGRSQVAYLTPRVAQPGDWTSTTMMAYIPGDTYTVEVQADGTIDQTISFDGH